MKRTPLTISILVFVGVLIAVQAVLGNIVANQFQEWLGPWARYVLPAFLLITAGLIGYAVRDQLPGARERQDGQHDDRQAAQNRRAMLRKVRTIWIDGLLNHSLYQETLIALGLHERPDAVVRPLDVLVHLPQQRDKPLPPDTRMIEVFDACDGALLILGAPGSGKTTLLLELARDLLDRAEHDAHDPIPVVFPLSSWAERQLPLVEWLVDELNQRYDVPRTLAQSWVTDDAVLPLLDGLDEVNAEVRKACVQAINTFRQHKHGLRPLVVSCRITDYEALSVKLRLHGAIVVQPLTREQVKAYLWQIDLRVTPISTSPLWELLVTPLMLNIAILTYAGQTAQILPADGTPEEQHDHLFTAYVARMFQRNSQQLPFAQQQTVHWLSWLAWQMQRHNQTVFYLERMQPSWLPGHRRRVLRLLYILVVGLGSGVVFGVIFELGLGLVFGLGFGLGFGLLREQSIILADKLRWSRTGRRYGLGGSFVAGLVFGVIFGLRSRPMEGLMIGLVLGLMTGLGIGLIFGLSRVEVKHRAWPNESIYRSAQSALLVGLGVWLVFGLLCGLLNGLFIGLLDGLSDGLRFGLVFGLLCGLTYGGNAWIRHYLLRLLLVRQGVMPFHYVEFLDFAAQRILLRKVGGGYIFIHRLLLDHFAKQYRGPETLRK